MAAQDQIAIIGMGCRFPGARDHHEYWNNLRDGVETLSVLTEAELTASGISFAEIHGSDYVPVAGCVPNIDMFDAPVFGMTPRNAAVSDPQQRLFLECVWECLETAGYDPARSSGTVGLFAGQAASSYLHLLRTDPRTSAIYDDRELEIANEREFLAATVAYRLDLRGPVVSLNTACSTSLVAVHMAIQSLLNGECEMALAGGVSIRVPQQVGYRAAAGVRSADGHCRPFDAAGDGSVNSGGAGVILLKPFDTAITDGDHIRAVIIGSAINSDGANKAGFSSPSVEQQTAVITEALTIADAHPESITYIEAHGTATPVGDPLEVAALTAAYRTRSDATGWCGLGSVKSNIGHTDAAAGIAGLIKVALALEHEFLPATLNYTSPNPEIDFDSSPFVVMSHGRAWPRSEKVRRAAVSAFGLGGTNAHVVLQEAPVAKRANTSPPRELLVLSARTPTALRAALIRLTNRLEESGSNLNIGDVAHTLRTGRRVMAHRAAITCRDIKHAVAELREEVRSSRTRTEPASDAPVAFLFPGAAAQYPGMISDLYAAEPLFRAAVDHCCGLLDGELAITVRNFLIHRESHRLEQPSVALPALFISSHALALLWQSWGVEPAALIGHSVGEYVAAVLAGTLSITDALLLVAARGRLVEQVPPGAMLAVKSTEAELTGILTGRLGIAAVNGPFSTIVSGPLEEIAAFEEQLQTDGVMTRRLNIRGAGHSSMVDDVVDELVELVRTVPLAPPSTPWISGVTGKLISGAEACEPEYWGRQFREPVRFMDGLTTLLSTPGIRLVEMGPHRTLATFAAQHPDRRPEHLIVSSLPHPDDGVSDLESTYTALGEVWVGGGVDLSRFRDHDRNRRVPLPTYPFERKRHWAPLAADAVGDIDQLQSARMESATPLAAAEPVSIAIITQQLNVMRRQLMLLRAHETTDRTGEASGTSHASY